MLRRRARARRRSPGCWPGAGSRSAPALLVVLVALAGAAALNRPDAVPVDVLPALVAGVVGVAAAGGWSGSRPGDADRADARRGPPASAAAACLSPPAALAVAAVAMGGAGRWIAPYRARSSDITLPAAADPAPALPAGLDGDVPGITPFRTPNDDFYRVDTRLTVPQSTSTPGR